MSTLKVDSIVDGGGSGAPTAPNGLTVGTTAIPTAGALSNRNLIINGAMQVAQRGTSVTGATASGYKAIDRYHVDLDNAGTWTISQDADAPSDFGSSMKFLCTTADASLGSTHRLAFRHRIEGQDLQRLKKGTTDANKITVSFHVKSNKTGTYILEFYDLDNSRHINKSYTVASANTWEYKTITFDADGSGVFDNDNAASAHLHFWLAAGSNYSSGTLQTSWGSAVTANRAVGNVNLADTVNNYFQITGVQLEVGDTATPFEHRSYGDELARCQRYYQKIGYDGGTNVFGAGSWYTSTNAYGYMSFLQTMRASPTMTAPTASNGYKCYTGGSTALASTLNFERVSNKTARIGMVTSGGTTGYGTWFELNGVSPCNIIMDAEL